MLAQFQKVFVIGQYLRFHRAFCRIRQIFVRHHLPTHRKGGANLGNAVMPVLCDPSGVV